MVKCKSPMNLIGDVEGSPLPWPLLFQMQPFLKRLQDSLTLDFLNLDPKTLTQTYFKDAYRHFLGGRNGTLF